MADWSNVDGKVVGGQSGEGVLIEFLHVKSDKNAKTGDDMLWVEIGGIAHTVLKSNYAPEQGTNDLAEPLPVSTRIDLLNSGKKDNKITFEGLNKAFGLEPPLEDKEDELLRFMQDGENSVYEAIVGHHAYFRMKLAPGKVGDKPTDFYANIIGQAKTHEPKVASVKDIIAKAKEKAAEKAAKEAELNAQLVGSGVSTNDVPF